ncbi:hypothetical protein IMG5_196540 [Ichthyophthirius multifiliis]|uniref:Uncharacterized protein n=1 Tax=Ichthyophthirius multifiliis TaxID=5932 RepID=G0R560_ICHMU|nr:hypothetical protein IMG5_196540 [Ichthyophthirius multifiliis]EGR27384.1 hypothetical protein IMG5_196540 [Ichthyophthirius multifiliis]|eukprot:XP_004024268.1 hypothetical protein IMG5_196540 [Ichthyophthirius multifiliis]
MKEKDIRRKTLEQEGKNSEKEDIINYLIKNKLLEKIDIQNIAQDFIAFYIAGIETTSHLTGMIIYYLTQYKEVKEKLIKEINGAQFEQIQTLVYLNAVIKECLRFYTSANQLGYREATKDHYLQNIFIPKGTLVTPLIIGIHRNPLYYENPHVFDPERWLKDIKYPPYSYIPFSAGKRNCLGQHMASIEAKIILYYFLKTFDFECDEGFELKMQNSFLYHPLDPLQINLKVKNNEFI